MTIRPRFKRRRKELASQIGQRCRARRTELGYSQQVAALISGVGLKTIQRIELGRTLPALDSLGRYADGLGLRGRANRRLYFSPKTTLRGCAKPLDCPLAHMLPAYWRKLLA